MLRQLLLVTACFVLGCLHCEAQTSIIEKLKQEVAHAKDAQQKLSAIFALCEEKLSLSNDTLYAYASTAKKLAEQQNNKLQILRADYYITYSLLKNGLYDSILNVCNTNIEWLTKNSQDKSLRVDFAYLKAQALIRGNRYKEALSHYYSMLSEADATNDTLMQIKTNTGIGWVYMEMSQNADALTWFYKALHVSGNAAYYAKYTALYSNIASTYNNMGRFDSAVYYINKAIEGATQNQVLSYLANALNIRADIFINLKNNTAAGNDLNRALSIRKQVGDVFYIVSDISQLAFFYAENHLPQKGIALAKQGIDLATKYHLEAKLPFLYSALADNYKQSHDYVHYAETLEKLLAVKDSVYETNSAEALAEIQAKYDLQKKENIIIQQKLALVSKNYLFYGSLLLLLVGVVLLLFFFRSFRRKQAMKMELLMMEEKRIANEAVFRAEENERKRIAADLHDNLGAYASAISANVDDIISAGNNDTVIQNMKKNAGEIMMSLRDTIWVLNKEAIHLTGISDRFKNYVQKLSASYPAIAVEIKETIINDISISPESSLSMLRIMQEAFHNALKHSRCRHITAEISCSHILKVSICDDGTGFTTQPGDAYGTGIQNMHRRAQANGWQLQIKHLTPNGTLVELTVDTIN